ncbi:MAG: ABC transporter ATP-binding protein [Planctomycetaceae bacterium]|nr:ABC transporter ATP-binding protein [Planctomycetaceae bacterium]
MTKDPHTAFQRVMPRRLWWQGAGKWVVFWSILAGVLLCLLLVIGSLLADVLATRGHVLVPSEQADSLRARLGELAIPEPPAGDELAQSVRLDSSGILPAVVLSETRGPWGAILSPVYRAVPALGDNVSGMLYLLSTGAVCALLFTISLSRAKAASLKTAMQVVATQREHLHRQALRLGPGDLLGRTSQEVMSLFTKESEIVRTGIARMMQSVVRDLIMLVLLSVLALSVDWRLTLQCLVPLAACWWLVHYERSRGLARKRLATAQADTELRRLSESLNKTRIVRGYNMEEFEHRQFESALKRYTREISSGLKHERWSVWVSRVLMVMCIGLVLYMIAVKVLAVNNPLSVFGAVLLLLAFSCMVVVAEFLLQWGRLRNEIGTAADALIRYFNRIPEVGQAVGAKFLDPMSKSIIFESVNYSLNGTPILKGFDLRLAAGTTTAIVSPDPLGAQTVAYLLPRFVEPQSGRVLFDSEDINWGTLESLRAETAYVGGGDACFAGSVLENITCGQKGYGLPEATEAAKMVHAHKFITGLSQGYETQLGEHGEQLEPGQAFLIGLARAALRKPAVLIIEEPKAKLDKDTKALLDDAYTRLSVGRTVVFLPTRLSTVRRSQQVVFVRGGKVEGVGSHQELLKKSEHYRHWEYMTFNAIDRADESKEQIGA